MKKERKKERKKETQTTNCYLFQDDARVTWIINVYTVHETRT